MSTNVLHPDLTYARTLATESRDRLIHLLDELAGLRSTMKQLGEILPGDFSPHYGPFHVDVTDDLPAAEQTVIAMLRTVQNALEEDFTETLADAPGETVVDLARVDTCVATKRDDGRIGVELEVPGLGHVVLVGSLSEVLGHAANVAAGAHGVEAERQ